MPVKRILLITCAAATMTLTMRSPSDATGPGVFSPTLPDALTAVGSSLRGPEAPVSALAATGSSATGQNGAVDIGALRYFAAEKNAGRVDAEIRLIRKTHPDFQPPEDLYSEGQGSGDEHDLWNLYARHDLAGLRARMDDLRRGDATWHPSSDLADKITLAEAHETLVKASDEKRWADVIGTATGTKGLLTCGDPDALWRTAEALGQTGDEVRALAAYQYVLATCPSSEVRLSTVQKAGIVLRSTEAFDKLLKMGRRLGDGRDEFDSIRMDQIRRNVGEAAGGSSQIELAPADIDRLAAFAKTPTGEPDAQLLAWYFYSRADYPNSQQWFKAALALDKKPQTAEGLVLALQAGGNMADARTVSLQYAGLDDPNRKLMVEVLSTSLADPKAKALTVDEMTTLTRAVDQLKVQAGAQALASYHSARHDLPASRLWSEKYYQWREEQIDATSSAEEAKAYGWELFHDGKVAKSEAWFTKSAKWEPSESSAIGRVLVAYRLHHKGDYASRVADYRTKFAGVAQLEAESRPRPGQKRGLAFIAAHGDSPSKEPAQRRQVARERIAPHRSFAADDSRWDQSATDIVKAAQSGKYDEAMTMLEQRRSKKLEPRGLSVVRGWVLYNRGQWEDAKQVFSNLDNGSYSPERREGLRMVEYSYTNPRFR